LLKIAGHHARIHASNYLLNHILPRPLQDPGSAYSLQQPSHKLASRGTLPGPAASAANSADPPPSLPGRG
jgi:hypothetical protein